MATLAAIIAAASTIGTYATSVGTTVGTIYSSVSSSQSEKKAGHRQHKAERTQAIVTQKAESGRREQIRRMLLRGRRRGVATTGRGVLGRPATERQELKTALGA